MNATELLQEALEEEDAERVAALKCIEESLPDARLRRPQRRTT